MNISIHRICAYGLAVACCFLLSSSVCAADRAESSDKSGAAAAGSVNAGKPEQSPKPVAGYSIPITMYSQNDPAWASFLYGGRDPMSSYGCGPTALAIAVTSLTGTEVTPIAVAQWAADNGYFSPGSGSAHGLIPDGAKNYGLTVEKISTLTAEAFQLVLSVDKLVILLMGPGDFSDSGHFIVAYGYDAVGNILIADPASQERSSVAWPAETLAAQLLPTARSGGPVWVLSKP